MEMHRFFPRVFFALVAVLLLLVPASRANLGHQKPKKKERSGHKDILNFDGGILFETDGALSELTCFRLRGRATAPHFFDEFKRIDDDQGTEYRSGQQIVAEFPEELHVSLAIVDFSCRNQLQEPAPRKYLTQEMLKSLTFSFYWKRGIELRHIENTKLEAAVAEPIKPYNTESKEELPKLYPWFLKFTIPTPALPLPNTL